MVELGGCLGIVVRYGRFLTAVVLVLLLCPGHLGAFQEKGILSSNSTDSCRQGRVPILSAAYSPYSVHLIKSEVNGRIVRINAVEGKVLKAGTPLVQVDSKALEGQLEQLQHVLDALKNSERVLSRDLELAKKKYDRYLALRGKGHIEEQAVENMEKEFHSAELTLIENKRQQAEVRRNMIQLRDQILKCAPSFPRDFYVAENFKELYETVVPGENISRLLDISKVKLHLVLSPRCFSSIEESVAHEKTIPFQLITEDGKVYPCIGHVEKLKIDPDNNYLYSYGFDLVFRPVAGILWGQVVKVRLELGHHEGYSSLHGD